MQFRLPPPARAVELRALGRVEARRYARHPVFVAGLVFLALRTIPGWINLSGGFDGNLIFAPAIGLGLAGVFVSFRLTCSMDRAAGVAEAAPADGVLRTAALCLACLVPGAVALVWLAVVWVRVVTAPLAGSPAFSTGDLLAILLTAVVSAVGGPLLGVLVGRWAPFPGAGLITVLALVTWTMITGVVSERAPASRLNSLIHMHVPFTGWVGGTPQQPFASGGSPQGYLAYITVLCALAALLAMLHEATGPQRSRLQRSVVIASFLAVISLAMIVASDPTRVPLSRSSGVTDQIAYSGSASDLGLTSPVS